MFNLILKDLLVQKKTLPFLGLYIIVFMFAFQSIGTGAFAGITIAITYQMVASASNYDEKANSDIIMNSMPLDRKAIVLSKYLSVILYFALATLGYMAFSIILSIIPIPINIPTITQENLVVAFLGVMVMNSIYYPVYFKMGNIKARIVSFILFFGAFFGVISMLDLINDSQNYQILNTISTFFNNGTDTQILLVMVGGTTVILLISYVLSVMFYNNREF